jgi:hypothetical protein
MYHVHKNAVTDKFEVDLHIRLGRNGSDSQLTMFPKPFNCPILEDGG